VNTVHVDTHQTFVDGNSIAYNWITWC